MSEPFFSVIVPAHNSQQYLARCLGSVKRQTFEDYELIFAEKSGKWSRRPLYLKALEIQGFKSFPEKVILPFDKRVIAIVGPNGSGKSNISDAICWVMGEQRSRTLRGAKMEDVIFAIIAAARANTSSTSSPCA